MMIEKLDSPFIAKNKVKLNHTKGEARLGLYESIIMDYHAACTELEQENMKLKKIQEKILKENKKLARAGKMLKTHRDELMENQRKKIDEKL